MGGSQLGRVHQLLSAIPLMTGVRGGEGRGGEGRGGGGRRGEGEVTAIVVTISVYTRLNLVL